MFFCFVTGVGFLFNSVLYWFTAHPVDLLIVNLSTGLGAIFIGMGCIVYAIQDKK